MPPADIVLFGVLIPAVVIGVFGGVGEFFSPANRLKRQLRSMPRRSLAEVPEGTTAHVAGKVELLSRTLEAPLSGRSCVYFETIVTVKEGTSCWELVREARCVSFILDDGTARAVVDPHGCKTVLDFEVDRTTNTFDNATERELVFLRKHDRSTTGDFFEVFNRKLTFHETIVEVGEKITIIGEGVSEPDPEGTPAADYRGAAPTRLRMVSSPRQPMIISDVTSVPREAL